MFSFLVFKSRMLNHILLLIAFKHIHSFPIDIQQPALYKRGNIVAKLGYGISELLDTENYHDGALDWALESDVVESVEEEPKPDWETLAGESDDEKGQEYEFDFEQAGGDYDFEAASVSTPDVNAAPSSLSPTGVDTRHNSPFTLNYGLVERYGPTTGRFISSTTSDIDLEAQQHDI
jgi:hypothetical protein